MVNLNTNKTATINTDMTYNNTTTIIIIIVIIIIIIIILITPPKYLHQSGILSIRILIILIINFLIIAVIKINSRYCIKIYEELITKFRNF